MGVIDQLITGGTILWGSRTNGSRHGHGTRTANWWPTEIDDKHEYLWWFTMIYLLKKCCFSLFFHSYVKLLTVNEMDQRISQLLSSFSKWDLYPTPEVIESGCRRTPNNTSTTNVAWGPYISYINSHLSRNFCHDQRVQATSPSGNLT